MTVEISHASLVSLLADEKYQIAKLEGADLGQLSELKRTNRLNKATPGQLLVHDIYELKGNYLTLVSKAVYERLDSLRWKLRE